MLESTKIKITVSIPFDKPNRNNTIFTEDAVKNAICNLNKYLPILDENEKVIGSTIGDSHIVIYDGENQRYKVTVDADIYGFGPEMIINSINKDRKINDFRITGFSL